MAMLAGLMAVHSFAAARTPPAPNCMDARRMQEARQASPTVLGVMLDDNTRFRIDLAQPCPEAVAAGQASVLAREGWACGTPPEFVASGEQRCPIAAVTPIDAREYASIARAGDRDANGVSTLDTVTVTAEKRNGFAGTTAYCLNPRWMRSWSEDGKGLIVEMSPKRAGGNRFYRVELTVSCPDLADVEQIELRSGRGIGIVCGNPGDVVAAVAEAPFASGRRANSPVSRTLSCPIAAVYPIESGS